MLNIMQLRFQSILLLTFSIFSAVGIGLLMAGGDYEWQGLLMSALAIGTLSLFLLPRMSRPDNWRPLLSILTTGLILKLGFSLLLLWIGLVVYGGQVDVAGYHAAGVEIAEYIWRLQSDQIIPFLKWGTKFVDFFTGVVYSLTGPTLYGGHLIYASLGFLGSYYFYRAFRVSFPQGNRQLYAVLVFFSPSILLWSNGIGKDALTFLFLGLFVYGLTELNRSRLQGFVPLVLGFLGVVTVRPHVAVILAIATVIGFFIPEAGKKTSRNVISLTLILLAGGVFWVLLPQLKSYLMIEELSTTAILSAIQRQQSLTFAGGSAFHSVDISNPLNFPAAMVTVLFRPFPWEAHNFLALAQSLEGLIFIGLALWRIKSIGRSLVSSISNANLRFVLIYIIGFIIIFSSVQNFGTLARWRTMMLPFFFILMSYAPGDVPGRPKPVEKLQTSVNGTSLNTSQIRI